MPEIWKWISYLFPSTHGIQGYIKINSSGATLSQVRFEYVQLWLQAVLYLLASTISLSLVVKKEKTTTQR
jgi:ABC-2 type transport system permease protein